MIISIQYCEIVMVIQSTMKHNTTLWVNILSTQAHSYNVLYYVLSNIIYYLFELQANCR